MSRRAPLVIVLVLAVGAVSACQKRDEGSGKPAPIPPLDPASAPAAPPPAPPPAPAEPPAAAPSAPAAAGGSITGKIVLAPSVAKGKPQGTLYLVARRISDNPTARGTLIAVKKLPATSFPLPFSLTAADMPFQNGPFDGELTLTARIDQDGDPMSHQKGDVFGSLPKVQVGAHDVKLLLDQVQKETESLAGGGGPMMGQPGGGALPPGHP
ncbi:MAG: hypothetical protein ABUL67_02025 [Haliangium ochraceum]